MSEQTVLITGVGRRIGLHVATTLLQRGVHVIGTYRTERHALDALRQHGAELVQCDFTDNSAIAALASQILARHECLRAVIHNASEWHPDDAGDGPAAVMQQMMQVHVSAPYQLNLLLRPLLEACQHSHADIVHIGDYVSTRGSSKHIAYAASKAAQDNLSYSFAALLAPKIKVNSIAPALVLFNDGDDAAYRANARDKSLMQREAGLDEFMRTLDYVLESEYVTGRVLALDGGRHLR